MRYKVPVVEANPFSRRTDIVLVPLEGLDYFLSDISGDYDLGLGTLSGELGAVKVKAKASVNVKKPAPPPPKPKPKTAPPKPIPKPPPVKAAPKAAAPKPVNKPAVSKSLSKPVQSTSKPKTVKSVAKPAAGKSAAAKKPIAKISVKSSAKTLVSKKATTAKKPAIKQIKPATKAKLSTLLAKTKGSVKTSAAKKPVKKLDMSKIKAVAKKAVSAVQAMKRPPTTKPIAVRTEIKEGLYPKVTPTSKVAQEGAAAARAVLSIPQVKSLPADTRTRLAISAAAQSAAPAGQVVTSTRATKLAKKPSSKPIAKMVKKLDKTQPSKSCTCVVATKKPEQAGLNMMPSLEARYAALEARIKRLGKAAGVRYV